MYIAVSEYDIIKAYGESIADCASHLFKWSLDTDNGILTVEGKVQPGTYAVYAKDNQNGFKPNEMYAEVHKDLVKIAKQKGFTFYKEL